MAYFSNGSEGMIFDDECAHCPLGREPCPIAWVQMEFNYEACNKPLPTKILNCLVKQEPDGDYTGCQMKPLLDKLEIKK